jgi:hypothetical protein
MATTAPVYNLRQHGDGREQAYYDRFIAKEFPSYEIFWQKAVTPLTYRSKDLKNIHVMTDAELQAVGKGAHHICLSQLHYSILLHLIRVYDLKSNSHIGLDHLVFGMSAIIGGQDIAFELLQRFKNPTTYDPWLDKRRGGKPGGREAQADWKAANNYPLQHLRDYRNNLVHGRMTPSIINGMGGEFYFPQIGKELSYFDWRKVTSPPKGILPIADFATARDILNSAWKETLIYFETNWKSELLPNI